MQHYYADIGVNGASRRESFFLSKRKQCAESEVLDKYDNIYQFMGHLNM